MEDEVQYLGRNAPPADPVVPSALSSDTHRPVSGILLHIPKTAEQPGQSLRYYKIRTQVVNIGRASGSNVGKERQSIDTATFRCPVISRRHAKILLSDTGHVYLVDLDSHHGTHLLKQGGTVSQRLIPEVPVLLEDGDTVTFGKIVGRDSYVVRPVTVNIRLLHGVAPNLSSPAPIEVPIPPILPPDSPEQFNCTPKSSTSGRYGVFGSSPSSSSDSSSSSSQPDSDIEEIERPEEYPDAQPDFSASRSYFPDPSLPSIHGLGLLKRMIPPISCPPSLRPSLMSFQSSRYRWLDTEPSASGPGPSGANRFPNASDGEAVFNGAQKGFSDLMFLDNVLHPSEPLVIGAYPNSRAVSPSHSSLVAIRAISMSPEMEEDRFEGIVPEAPPLHTVSVAECMPVDVAEESHPDKENDVAGGQPDVVSQANLEEDVDAGEQDMIVDSDDDEHEPGVIFNNVFQEKPESESEILSRFSRLEGSLVDLRSNVLRLRIAHRKTQADLKSQADRAFGFDKRIDETNDLFQSLWNRIEGAYDNYFELSQELAAFRERLDSHQGDVDKVRQYQEQLRVQQQPPAPSSEVLQRALVEREDVKTSVEALHALVASLKDLRDSTTAEVEHDLQALKAARTLVIDKTVDHAGLVQNDVTPSPSLKRKRSASEDEACAVSEVADRPRPLKRGKIAAATQTAALVMVGAVAAWSALAFA